MLLRGIIPMSSPPPLTITTGKKVHPNRFRYFLHNYFLVALLSSALFLAGFLAAFSVIPGGAMLALPCWIIAAIAAIATIGHTALHCNATVIYLTGEEIIYETGIISHQKVSVPLHMITDTKLDRELIDKLLGTATIRINTSGGKDYEIVANFEFDDLNELYNEIYRLIRKTPTSMPDAEAKK